MNVYVIGAATSKFGEFWGVSPRQLVRETVKDALDDAKLSLKDIDAIYVGNMLSGMLGNQENLGALFAEELGAYNHAPTVKIEGACASGGLAVHHGVLGILSNQYKRVLVVGVENMTDHSSSAVSSALMGAGSDEERMAGLTFPGLYAMIARAHMERYGTTEKDMAAVSVKNHFHASHNPHAHFQKPVSLEMVMNSPYVADPLKLLDCSPISDGAAAVILSKDASKKTNQSVSIVASAVSSDSLGLSGRKTLTSLKATEHAGKKAYSQAKLTPNDISVAEVHDCFSIAEILALEDLGFYKKGQAARPIRNGDLTLGSSKKLVVNTSGGLKACGHPVGATGVKQIVEIVKQLQGVAEDRQVKNARIGLTHNVGGSGAVAVVHILTNAKFKMQNAK